MRCLPRHAGCRVDHQLVAGSCGRSGAPSTIDVRPLPRPLRREERPLLRLPLVPERLLRRVAAVAGQATGPGHARGRPAPRPARRRRRPGRGARSRPPRRRPAGIRRARVTAPGRPRASHGGGRKATASPRRSGASTPVGSSTPTSRTSRGARPRRRCARRPRPARRPTIRSGHRRLPAAAAPVDGQEQGAARTGSGAPSSSRRTSSVRRTRPRAEPGLAVGQVHRRRMPDQRGRSRAADPSDRRATLASIGRPCSDVSCRSRGCGGAG